MDRDLGEALGQVFVAKTFSPATKTKTRGNDEVRGRGHGRRDPETGLDERRHEEARPGEARDDREQGGLSRQMAGLQGLAVARGDFFGNVRRATVFESKRAARQDRQAGGPDEWGMTPPTVNAYYDPQMNDINFPAGVLQPPLYDPKMDDAPNYGNTGSTIGHELTHGFDDEGRQFDAQGNLKDWWTREDAAGFEERAQVRPGPVRGVRGRGRHQDPRAS